MGSIITSNRHRPHALQGAWTLCVLDWVVFWKGIALGDLSGEEWRTIGGHFKDMGWLGGEIGAGLGAIVAACNLFNREL